jgi:hypothetical protein
MISNKVLITQKITLTDRIINLAGLNILPVFTLFVNICFSPMGFSNILFLSIMFSFFIPISIYFSFYYTIYYDVYICENSIVFFRNNRSIYYEISKYKEIKIEYSGMLDKSSNICYFSIDKKRYKVRYNINKTKEGYIVDLLYKPNYNDDTKKLHAQIETIICSR